MKETDMSVEIDPREVLEHLEYLGYSSISKEQLKDFIRDLKKLIKYEKYKEQRLDTRKEQEELKKVSVACETSLPYYEERRYYYTSCEEPGPPRNVEYFISSGVPHSKSPTRLTPTFEKSYHCEDYDAQKKTEEDNCLGCCKHCGEKADFKNCVKKECCETEKQPCPSFIRPGVGKPSKCDPVALYHYYQNQWSKRPLPGEDPRTDLRWAVRTRLAQQKRQALHKKPTSIDVHPQKVII